MSRLCGLSLRWVRVIGAAAAIAAGPASADLFDEPEPLALSLTLDFGDLCRSDDCAPTPATLAFTAGGTERQIAVGLRTRGRWRNDASNCSVPPLAVFFDAAAAGTPFAGETMLPLTTHCRDKPAAYEQYVLKEHIAYGIYNALTAKSPRTRLARITYRDTRRGHTVERFAFFTEHFDSVAARNGATYFQPDAFDPREGNALELATVDLFEFLIGNTDWSAVAGHNIALIRTPEGSVSPIAYDFDFSGIVAAFYAEPPPQLRIRHVTQRVFRGFCYPDVDWPAVFDRFRSRRAAIEAAIDTEVDTLLPAQRESARKYVAGFFAILDSPERRQRDIVGACRPLTEAD
ncbi:MAG TPA: hypothetical protein VFX89_02790 [Gammaproteobacteria bacterium]|nr:hypothetical protein [Gammaproteobacteria bacterium]